MSAIIISTFTKTEIDEFEHMKSAIADGWDTGFNDIDFWRKEVDGWKQTIKRGGRRDFEGTDREQLASAQESLAYGLRFQLYLSLSAANNTPVEKLPAEIAKPKPTIPAKYRRGGKGK